MNQAAPAFTLLATTTEESSAGGITYYVAGELVPVLTLDLPEGSGVFFEHHILLWKHIGITITVRSIKGAAKRMLAGMQVFTTEAHGPGQIAFSRDDVGHVFAMHLRQGDDLHVREHQFLAATSNVDYTFERVQGVANILLGGSGFFIDKFRSPNGDGTLWLHGYGNVFEKVLAAGEQIDVEPGAWLYKDTSVQMETKLQKLSTGLLGGFTLAMNRFTGPGRLGMQSLSPQLTAE